KHFFSTATKGDLLVAQMVKAEAEEHNLFISFAIPLPPNPKNVIALDNQYDQIADGSWLVIERPDGIDLKPPLIYKADTVSSKSIARYGISGKTTEVTFGKDWLEDTDLLLTVFRETTVFAQTELLELAEAPISTPIGK